jgi:hypothetical protein
MITLVSSPFHSRFIEGTARFSFHTYMHETRNEKPAIVVSSSKSTMATRKTV